MNVSCERGQRGMVLVISLIMLLVLGMLTITVFKTNLVQIKMASNAQQKADALQQVHAMVDALLMQQDNFTSILQPGSTLCALHDTGADCNVNRLNIPAAALPASGFSRYYIVRQLPASTVLPVMRERVASSAIHYRAAIFDVHARYDGQQQARGRASVTQGVMALLAGGGE